MQINFKIEGPEIEKALCREGDNIEYRPTPDSRQKEIPSNEIFFSKMECTVNLSVCDDV